MDGHAVKVYIYDISKGMAKNLSLAFLGKQIEGVWHTGVVVYGQEFFFGGGGIESCPPMGTILGRPDSIQDLGNTQVPQEVFMDYLKELSSSTFRPECYHLLEHNCNTFSSEVAQFLTGRDIPSHITNLPAEVLSTPFGQMLKPLIDSMTVTPQGGTHVFSPQTGPSSASTPSAKSTSKPRQDTPTSSNKTTKPNIKDRQVIKYSTSVLEIFEKSKTTKDQLIRDLPAEGVVLSEVVDYLSVEECSWSLSPQHIQILGAVLLNSNSSETTRLLAGSLLQAAALKPDVVMAILHDPKTTVSRVISSFEMLPEQLLGVVIKLVVNCASSKAGHQLLTSEASVKVGGESSTNLKLTTTFCVHCLLDNRPELWELSASAVTNLLIYGVSEDTSIELGSAVLQCLTREISENTASLLLWDIMTLMTRSSEVRALTAVMEVDWERFSSLSVTCRNVTQEIKRLLSS